MGFQFAKVIAQLGEGVSFRRKLESGEDGFMDLAGAPAAELSATIGAGLP